MRLHFSRRLLWRTSAAVAASAALTIGSISAAAAGTAASRTIGPGTRFFVPPPSVGAPQQIVSLLKNHDPKDAALIAKMESIPRAVWFTSGTPAQVGQQARQ